MPLAFLSFVLIALHVSVMVDSKPWQHNQDLQQIALTNPAQSERRTSQRSSKWPDFLVTLPVKTHSGNFVSIFDLRRKRYLCMDQKGELFNSKARDTEDCLFQQLWLDWPTKHDVYYSTSAARLLKFQGVEFPAVVRHKLVERMFKRQKRSEVNPSDPLHSETHPHPARTHVEQSQPNRDQTGAVSKETINSCDDPLKVLQANGPGSPIKVNIEDQADDAKVVKQI